MIKLNLNLLLLLLISIFSVLTSSSYSESEKFYNELVNDWPQIFPDSNRNAAGPKFYNHILKKYNDYEDFKEVNKLYCAVSGSLIRPNSTPSFVYLNEEGSDKKVCGYYYKCCWPCVCDLMKYATVKKVKKTFKNRVNEYFVLLINNPCNKLDFPKKVNKNYFCKNNKLDKKQVSVTDDNLIIGVLHDAKYCSPSDLRKIYANRITGRQCSIRNRTPLDQIQSGMGDVFITLAK